MTQPTPTSDEQQIRELITRWGRSAQAANVDTMRECLHPDALFLPAGHPSMDAEQYLQSSAALAAAVSLDCDVQVIEVFVSGELAIARTHVTVHFTPLDGSSGPSTFAGPDLLVFRRGTASDGAERWLVWRDANLVVPQKQ